MKTLPKKPSKLIRLAIGDLEKVEKDKRYKIDMTDWHRPGVEEDAPCAVCLAGSVMAKTLKAERDQDVGPFHYYDEISQKLDALNELRLGRIRKGVHRAMGLNSDYDEDKKILKSLPRKVTVGRYTKTTKATFKRNMRKIATFLEKRGL